MHHPGWAVATGSRRTALTGGVLVTIAAVIDLLAWGRVTFPIDATFEFPFAGTIAGTTAAVLLAAGFAVLAVGLRRSSASRQRRGHASRANRERGIVGRRPLDATALIVFGAADVLAIVDVRTGAALASHGLTSAGLELVVVLAGFVAADAVVQRGRTTRGIRGTVVALVVVVSALALLGLVPVEQVALAMASVVVVRPLAFLALGVALLVAVRGTARSGASAGLERGRSLAVRGRGLTSRRGRTSRPGTRD